MAIVVPETIKAQCTAGERILFQTLKNYLPDDYIVYYEPHIRGCCPDFVIIGPDMGVVVLEVKDITRPKLLQVDSQHWLIRTEQGDKRITSPLIQARNYMFKIMNTLEIDKDLIHLEGKYRLKLKFPCAYGTVFTRLSQQNFIEDDLYDVIPPNLCFTREEIDPDSPHFSEERFMEKLYSMFNPQFPFRDSLTASEINRIRFHLFPEVRIGAGAKERTPYQDQLLLSLHDIHVMDLHQEKLAKQLGDKNRLIRGVAGSGKTLILASRAKLLAKDHPEWRILILCYNVSLAKMIEQMVTEMMQEPEDLFDFVEEPTPHNIQVRTFHRWLGEDLKFHERRIPYLLEKLDKREIILPKYDAILIDEGQDFEDDWYKLVTKLLNPETMSLLLVEDRAQNIYRSRKSYAQNIGLDFRGRSKVLNINYRNTSEIVHFAWDFYQHFSKLGDHLIKSNLTDEIITPISTKRQGPKPAIKSFSNFFLEAEFIAKQIEKLIKVNGLPPEEICILYRVKYASGWKYIDVLKEKLRKYGVPYYWMTENDVAKKQFVRNEPSVKICTVDSSKGLDFSAVFLMAMQEAPFQKELEFEKEVSRIYIGMTRAKQFLCLSYSGESQFTSYFEQLQQGALVQREQIQ